MSTDTRIIRDQPNQPSFQDAPCSRSCTTVGGAKELLARYLGLCIRGPCCAAAGPQVLRLWALGYCMCCRVVVVVAACLVGCCCVVSQVLFMLAHGDGGLCMHLPTLYSRLESLIWQAVLSEPCHQQASNRASPRSLARAESQIAPCVVLKNLLCPAGTTLLQTPPQSRPLSSHRMASLVSRRAVAVVCMHCYSITHVCRCCGSQSNPPLPILIPIPDNTSLMILDP